MSNKTSKVTSILFIVGMAASSTFAAPSGTLNVSGSVAPVNDVVVTANGTNNSTLNITGGEAAKNIASVAETSNSASGYKIKMFSNNAGKLQRTASDYTTYQISYDGASYAAPSITPSTVKNIASLSQRTTNNSSVLVNVVAKPNALAGSYSDIITISIEANP